MQYAGGEMVKLRTPEWLIIGFFAYVAFISPWFQQRPFLKWQPLLLLVAVALAYLGLAQCAGVPHWARTVSFARDWLPIVATLIAFKEMGLFAPLHFSHHFEDIWIRWDDIVLRRWRMRSFIEALGPVIPFFLEACYFIVYGVGLAGVAVLYWTRNRRRVDGFLSLYVTGTLLAYALFPYFPSEPPRLLFSNRDAPHIFTALRGLNLWILQKGTIHSSVFPSAHVSSAFSAAWGLFFVLPQQKQLGGQCWSMPFACRWRQFTEDITMWPMCLLALVSAWLPLSYSGFLR